jgi:CRP-like cAMP-binding protein
MWNPTSFAARISCVPPGVEFPVRRGSQQEGEPHHSGNHREASQLANLLVGEVFVPFKVDAEIESKFVAKARTVQKPAGALLFRQGESVDGLYILKSGKARMTLRSTNGHVHFEETVEPGGLLGLPAAISGNPYSLTAELVDDSELSFLSRQELVCLMQDDIKLSMKLVELLSKEVRAMREIIAKPTAAGAD